MKIHKHNLIRKKSEVSQNYEYVQIFTFSQKKITIKVSYNNDVSLQNALSVVSNFTLNVLTRFFHSTLGFSKPN